LHRTIDTLALRRHADRAADGVVRGPSFGQRCTKVSGCLVASSLVHVDAVGGARLAHDILQRRAVAVEESGALRLTVVGEDHEIVRARSLLRSVLDPRELPIDLAQRRERIRSLDARVVGDLIIGKKGRVGDRPAGVEISDDRGYLEIALDHRSPRAH
jgi:hypothetical protein